MILKQTVKISVLVIALSMLLFLTACGRGGCPADVALARERGPGRAAAGQALEITVSAALSLTEALEDIKGLYEEQGDVTLTMNYGPSGALQQQIEQGAPVDIFISAAQQHMDALQEKKLIDEKSRVDLLENAVVLIIPAARGGDEISGFHSLASGFPGLLAIGEPESVPAGRYAKEILTSLGLWEQMEKKLVLGKDVRQVLTYVETGNVEAGIVYMTDALTSGRVKVAAIAPGGSHTPVIYPAAVVEGSPGREGAEDFMSFLLGREAAAVFTKHGFIFIAGEQGQ